MARLIDANILVRIVLENVNHPGYFSAVKILQAGGNVRDYVFPEVAYQYIKYYMLAIARRDAYSRGDLTLFEQNRSAYMRSHSLTPGWRKAAYSRLRESMDKLLCDYPLVQIDRRDIYDRALDIACQTGHDWVDCMLLAEHDIDGHDPVSLDKDVRKGVKKLNL